MDGHIHGLKILLLMTFYKTLHMKYLLFILLLPSLVVAPNLKEQRIKIAVIDTGINHNKEIQSFLCMGDEHRDFTKTNLDDKIGHGTNIAGLLIKHLNHQKHCLVILKYYVNPANDKNGIRNYYQAVAAFKYAFDINVSYINFSSSGHAPGQQEKEILIKLTRKGVKIAVAAGNEGRLLEYGPKCKCYPACYDIKKNFYVVGNLYNDNRIYIMSNYGPVVKYWNYGVNQKAAGYTQTGTSQATANFLSELIEKETK